MSHIRIHTLTLVLFVAAIRPAAGQHIPFDSDRWTITGEGSRVESHLGRPSLVLQEGDAILEDAGFTDGIIEFNISFSPVFSFPGVFWRRVDDANMEEFYFRPHLSGKPDANQYTPINHGLAGWQMYYGETYSAPVAYPSDTWIPVKVVVSGKRMEVYIQDMDQPVVSVAEMKRPILSGAVGVDNAVETPVYYSDFKMTRMSNPELKGVPMSPPAAEPGTVMHWEVSSAVSEADLTDMTSLSPAFKNGLSWTRLDAEASGVTNLAVIQGISADANTAIARVVIQSDRARLVPVEFGFSDRVRVFLNDQLLYAGSDNYTSRDYRFLGTVGWFDTLFLPLESGENELWFAVSENFGGWGIQARLPERTGLRFSDRP